MGRCNGSLNNATRASSLWLRGFRAATICAAIICAASFLLEFYECILRRFRALVAITLKRRKGS